MGAFGGPPREPVKGCRGCLNVLKQNWRGLLSTLLAFAIIVALVSKEKSSDKTLIAVWTAMFVFMLFRPMPASAAALLPLFCLPIFGVTSSVDCCRVLANENIILFYLCGWLLLLFNNCGLDKRLACLFLAAGKSDAYTPKKLLLKSCMAAFCISAISDRELTTQAIMTYVVSALEPLQIIKGEANYEELKIVLCNSIAISSMLGSMCFVHASLTTLLMRSMYHEAKDDILEYPDVFNFLNYSAYAVPVVLIMLILNTGYLVVLVTMRAGPKPMSAFSRQILQKAFVKHKSDLGPMTAHEKVSAFFLCLYMVCFFTRWSPWLGFGWATFSQIPGSKELCGVKDATTAAMFVVLLHYLPKSFNFLKIWTVKRKGDLPTMKPESGILFWKFVDKNTDYSLFLIFGASSMLHNACVITPLHEHLSTGMGLKFFRLGWNAAIFVAVFQSVFLGNLMTAMAAQACLMPLMLIMTLRAPDPFSLRRHMMALGVGLGSGLGFCGPYQHTPSLYVQTIGKVPLKKQIAYSVASCFICGIVLWLSLCFYGPLVFGKSVTQEIIAGGMPTSTVAAPGGDQAAGDATTAPP